MRFVVLVAMLGLAVLAAHGFADEPADPRVCWEYEGGWFAKAKDGTWYELNEFTFRKQGKPSVFREAKRTKEYVELYDESRKVTVRLSEAGSEVRLSDAKDAPFEMLYKGRWKDPVP